MEEETNIDALEAVEQIVIDFGDICRICLAETNSNISIHARYCSGSSTEKEEGTISDFIGKITSIEMDHSDGFPSLICEKCFSIISTCFEFRHSCRQSNFALQECYQKTLQEAKAKFSLKNIQEGNDESEKGLIMESLPQGLKSEEITIKVEECVEDFKIYSNENGLELINDNVIFEEGDSSMDLNKEKEDPEAKKDLLNVLKAGTIKQKYQRMSSLSERLKETQSKLIEDILRTKEIISSSTRNEHLVNASGEKLKFSCPRCSIKLVSSEMLTYHFITNHIADKGSQKTVHTFQCKICKKEFYYMYQLMRHYKNMHKVPMSKLSPEHLAPKSEKVASETAKRYQCLDCLPPKLFNHRKNYLRHLSDHGKMEDSLLKGSGEGELPGKFYTCTRCDSSQTFANKFTLTRHLMNIHKMDKTEIESQDGCKPEVANSEGPKLNLAKIYVCVDCSPPTSFLDLSAFVEHKCEVHQRSLEGLSLKELAPVYVGSVNVFEGGRDDTDRQTYKVICRSCAIPSEFYSASDFVQHMKVKHEDMPSEKWNVETEILFDSFPAAKDRDRVWKCTECPASYIRKHSLHCHLKEKHNKILRMGGLKCPESECQATFLTNRQVIQHGITVHDKYFANIHNVFKDRILLDPAEVDDRIRNFECDICQKKYLGKTSLKRHILKAHLGKSDMESAVCPYCGKTFSNNFNLKSHIEFVHEALFVSCPICKKNINFKTVGKHYKIHQSDKDRFDPSSTSRYLCNQCGRVLKSKSGFDDHQKLHLNVRDQICDICGNGFTTKKNLYIHKKAHDLTQKKVFECDKCDKVFTGKHTLKRHLLTHSGQKNFICEICSKCFYTLQELNRHVRYHRKEYRFDCKLCDMRFLDRSRFRHHMMRHRNIRPHKCHFCDKMFIVRRKMNLHMAARHNVEVQNTKAVWKDPKTYIPLDDLL